MVRQLIKFLVFCFVFSISSGSFAQSRTNVAAQNDKKVNREITLPLRKAQQLSSRGQYDKALQAVGEAEDIKNRSAYEDYLIFRTKASIATTAGRISTALVALDQLLRSPSITLSARKTILETTIILAYRSQDYNRVVVDIQHYGQLGGNKSTYIALEAQAYLQLGQYDKVVRLIVPYRYSLVKTGKIVPEQLLLQLIVAQDAMNDKWGIINSYIDLLDWYPKSQYWQQILNRLSRYDEVNSQIRLDLYFLQLSTNTLTQQNQFEDMAELALQQGFPKLAADFLQKGYERKIVSKKDLRIRKLDRFINTSVESLQKGIHRDIELAIAGEDDPFTQLKVAINAASMGYFKEADVLMEKSLNSKNLPNKDTWVLRWGVMKLMKKNRNEAKEIFTTLSKCKLTSSLAQLWLLRIKTFSSQ